MEMKSHHVKIGTKASDLLPLEKSQNWVQKVSTFRLSNIRVGHHITSLLGEKQDESGISHPSFAKSFVINKVIYVMVAHESSLQLWRMNNHTNCECDTQLVKIFSFNGVCIDGCVLNASDSNLFQICLVIRKAIYTSPDQHTIAIFNAHGPMDLLEKDFSDVPTAIKSTNDTILVSVSGSLRVINCRTLNLITELPTLVHVPVMCASSARWIALQVPAASVPKSSPLSEGVSHDSVNAPTEVIGDAARKIVSSIYNISKASWNVVSPFISNSNPISDHNKSMPHRHPSDDGIISKGNTDELGSVGGGVVVIDIPSIDSTTESLKSSICISRYVAHSTNLSCLAFSPSGLKLATADENGQIIMVHAVSVPAGMLARSHREIATSNNGLLRTPQLLYKLVRGISLASIVDIGFDESESVIYSATEHGTIHIFDLFRATESTSRSTSSSLTHSSFSGPSSGITQPLQSQQRDISPPVLTRNLSTSWSNGVLTDVSQQLQLIRPDLKVLQSYSDLRVRLPLSDYVGHSQEGDATDSGTEGKTSSYFPAEVNLKSSSILQAIRETSRGDSTTGGATDIYELCTVTSEGLFCRFRLSSQGQLSSNGGYSVLQVRECNRWDLRESNTSSDFPTSQNSVTSMNSNHVYDSNSDGVTISSQDANHLVAPSHVPILTASHSSISTSVKTLFVEKRKNSNNAWLYAAGDFPEPIEMPMWYCPNIALYTQQPRSVQSGRNVTEKSMFANRGDSCLQIKTRRVVGPFSTSTSKAIPIANRSNEYDDDKLGLSDGEIQDKIRIAAATYMMDGNGYHDSETYKPVIVKTSGNYEWQGDDMSVWDVDKQVDLSSWEMDAEWEEDENKR